MNNLRKMWKRTVPDVERVDSNKGGRVSPCQTYLRNIKSQPLKFIHEVHGRYIFVLYSRFPGLRSLLILKNLVRSWQDIL